MTESRQPTIQAAFELDHLTDREIDKARFDWNINHLRAALAINGSIDHLRNKPDCLFTKKR